MISSDMIIGVIVHLVILLFGFIVYWKVGKRMQAETISKPPNDYLFLIFVTYGGLGLVVVYGFFGWWSGLASLGSFYLILVAPFVMSIVAYKNYQNRRLSKYHVWTYRLGLMYLIILPVTILIGLFVS